MNILFNKTGTQEKEKILCVRFLISPDRTGSEEDCESGTYQMLSGYYLNSGESGTGFNKVYNGSK